MSTMIKRAVPQWIVTLIIFLMILFYFFYFTPEIGGMFTAADKRITDTALIIAAFAAIVGGLDIIRHHTTRLKLREKRNFILSCLVLILSISSSLAACIAVLSGLPITTQPYFSWLYMNIYAPGEAAMFSLLIFYTASASLRVFRARNLRALLLLIAAIIVMLGNVSLGEFIWGGFVPLRDWIMKIPNTAAFIPITIGIGFGIIILGIRLFLQEETVWMGRE